MRPLEYAIALSCLTFLCSTFFFKEVAPHWVRILPIAAVVFAAAVLLNGGYRWQMLPIYCVAAALLSFSLWSHWHAPPLRHVTTMTSLLVLLSGFFLSTAFPVFQFPRLQGPYQVGTTTRTLVDRSRYETAPGAPDGYRELVVQFWYPAQHAKEAKTANYLCPAATARRMRQISLVQTHAVPQAPVSAKKSSYPVLLFSPSWHGNRSEATFLVEQLASHGFIVACLDHPYSSGITVFPDGRVIKARQDGWLDYSSDQALLSSFHSVEEELEIRATDLRFTLSELARLNDHDTAGIFTGKFDTQHAGVLGTSFGGAAAAEACRIDDRFRAGMNMDGILFGRAAREGISQPFLFMSDDSPVPSQIELTSTDRPAARAAHVLLQDAEQTKRSLQQYGGYYFVLRGTSHANFSDAPLYSHLRHFTGAGQINPARAMQIISAYSIAFFQKHLEGKKMPLLDNLTADYPDVELTIYPPPELRATKSQ